MTMNQEQRVTPLVSALYIAVNVVSAIGIIIANKWLFDMKNFKYGNTLTALHQFSLALVFHLPYFDKKETTPSDNGKAKSIPRDEAIKLALLNYASLLFLTLSLVTNSVGFYQLTKLLVVPGLVAVQYFFYGKKHSNQVLGALGVLIIGIGFATVREVSASFLGTMWSIGVVLSSSFTVIKINQKMEQYAMTSTDLVKVISPWMGLFLILSAPFFDNYGFPLTFSTHPTSIFEYNDPSAIPWIILTCILGIGVNVTGYAVLKYTSPVTYQVVGHIKTCTILFLGYFLFGKSLSDRETIGISFAILGLVAYSFFKHMESKPTPKKDVESQPEEEDAEKNT